ncbi:hypothetical protein [Marmoricola endophyticus]|uniref:hypothetical protein n=1 Tax=Marmoricola endophyticus TaxID=2040280 RepID=UPI0016646D9D|nr:hypothetical protein [Marmoricola endophyticus]
MSSLSTRTTTRFAGLLACALLVGTTLTACGGDDDDPSSTPSLDPTQTISSTPTKADIPKKVRPGDISTKTTTSVAPVPKGGPKRIANFPVPRGYNIKGPKPQTQSWQFDVITDEPDDVLAFYRKALADDGYRVRTDVNEMVGVEKVHYDIEFTGPAKGYVVADPTAGSVFVLVESLPQMEPPTS